MEKIDLIKGMRKDDLMNIASKLQDTALELGNCAGVNTDPYSDDWNEITDADPTLSAIQALVDKIYLAAFSANK